MNRKILAIGLVGLALNLVSCFVWWWLCIVGAILGIIALCMNLEKKNKWLFVLTGFDIFFTIVAFLLIFGK